MKLGDQQVGCLTVLFTRKTFILMFAYFYVYYLGNLMQEIAQATFTYEQFPEVMGMLWKRMLGERKNWRRTYKVIICVFNFYYMS
jgi:ENTH domain